MFQCSKGLRERVSTKVNYYCHDWLTDQLPALQVLARVDWNPRKDVETRRGAEESAIPFLQEYTTRIRIWTRKYRIIECGVLNWMREWETLRGKGQNSQNFQPATETRKSKALWPEIKTRKMHISSTQFDRQRRKLRNSNQPFARKETRSRNNCIESLFYIGTLWEENWTWRREIICTILLRKLW